MLSISTSSNSLNFTVLFFNFDLSLISKSLNMVSNSINSLTSIKILTYKDYLFYFLTDNKNHCKVLTVYPNQTYDIWNMKTYHKDNDMAIIRFNGIIKESCFEMGIGFYCYFTLIHDYIHTNKLRNYNSNKSSSNIPFHIFR